MSHMIKRDFIVGLDVKHACHRMSAIMSKGRYFMLIKKFQCNGHK
jgi:hypothetical protein